MPRFRLDRYVVRLKAGDVLELAAAAMVVCGIYLLAGLGWCLISGGIAVVIGAEILYSNHVWAVPLPRIPHPIRKLRTRVFTPK